MGAMSTRYNVSLSDALSKRLEPHRDSLNLSALLGDAVAEELDRMEALETTLGPQTKEQRLEELRAGRTEMGEPDKQHGFACGAAWANEDADYEQAERLYEEVIALGNAHLDVDEQAHQIHGIVLSNGSRLGDELTDWFNDAVDSWDERPRNEEMFWQGFVRGASGAWETLREEL